MRRMIPIILLAVLLPSAASADSFSPTLLKLSAPEHIQYDFDGGPLEIPVTVTGTNAGVVFCVFTKDKAADIGPVTNGYLGWHYVNKVDTCIYYSTLQNFSQGENTLVWEGRDNDNKPVEPSTYTYYLWAFDNVGNKIKMMNFTYTGNFQEVDEQGAPLANPIYYSSDWRWNVGNEPTDESLLEITNLPAITDWGRRDSLIDPYDFKYVYYNYLNQPYGLGSIVKWKFVSGGDAELQTNFGTGGFSDIYSRNTGGSFGVLTDGEYLYTGDENHVSSVEPDAQFYIYDFEGALIDEIDLTSWWSDPASLVAGAQMNGGPNNAFTRHGKIFLNCHCSCLTQMVDPIWYLQDPDDFFVWSNGNGDITGDHNFEETAILKWICMDYNVGPYKYTIAADDNLFSLFNAYDAGAVSFGLFAPDGTGLGYWAYAGETAGWKRSTKIIDSGTPFDGLYPDNRQAGGTHYDSWNSGTETPGTYFIGHDSISGIIKPAGPSLELVIPASGDRLGSGTTVPVRWSSTDISTVRILYSIDGGVTWEVVADGIVADTGEYTWHVPAFITNDCRLRIEDTADPSKHADSGPFELSATYIRIIAPVQGDTVTGDVETIILWESRNVETVGIEATFDGGKRWQLIASGISATEGSYSWIPPGTLEVPITIRIYSEDDPFLQDISNPSVPVMKQPFVLKTPTASTVWPAGLAQTIDWLVLQPITVIVEFSANDGETWETLATVGTTASRYIWTPPSDLSSDRCRIRLTSPDFPNRKPVVSELFSIHPPQIEILAPSHGDPYLATDTMTISWTEFTSPSTVTTLDYSTNGGTNWNTIASLNSTVSGTYDWMVPLDAVGDCIIRLKNESDYTLTDYVTVTVTRLHLEFVWPVGGEKLVAGEDRTILWMFPEKPVDITIELSVDDGATWRNIDWRGTAISSERGERLWRVPRVESETCRFRIVCRGTVYDISPQFGIEMYELESGWTVQTQDDWYEPAYQCGVTDIVADSVYSVWTINPGWNARHFNGITWDEYANPPSSLTGYTCDLTGTVWRIVGDSGVNRNDGVDRILLKAGNSGLVSTAVKEVFAAPDNSIWFVYDYPKTVVSRLDKSGWTEFSFVREHDIAVAADEDGRVWIGSGDGLFTAGSGDGELTQVDRIPVDDIVPDHNGGMVLVRSDGTATVHRGGEVVTYSNENAPPELADVTMAAVDTDNALWFCSKEAVIRYKTDTPFLDMTAPEGESYYDPGDMVTVTWQAGGISTVRVEFSEDDGTTWTTLDDEVSASDNLYTFSAPETVSSRCRVRITACNASVYTDTTTVPFRIGAPYITLTSPNKGDRFVIGTSCTVLWSAGGVDRFRVEYSTDGGSEWNAAGTTTARYLTWQLPATITDVLIMRIVSDDDSGVSDESEGPMAIIDYELSLLSPAGGEVFMQNATVMVRWSTTPDIDTIKLEFSRNNGLNWVYVSARIDAGNGSYAYQLPATPSGQCYFRITDIDRNWLTSQNSQPFSIARNSTYTTWAYYTSGDNIGHDYVQAMAVAPNGDVWIATNGGLARFRNGEWMSWAGGAAPLPAAAFIGIAVSPDGTVWAATGEEGGVFLFDGSSWQKVNGGPVSVYKLYTDSQGSLWAGGRDDLVYRFSNGSWTSWNIDGCKGPWAFAEGPNGEFYCGFCAPGAIGGLFRKAGDSWDRVPNYEKAGSNAVRDIEFDSTGTMWVSAPTMYAVQGPTSYGGLTHILRREEDGTFTAVENTNEYYDAVISLDSHDRLWAGGSRKIFVYDNGAWETFDTQNSMIPEAYISDFAIAPDNTMWIATGGKGICSFLKPYLEIVSPNGGELWKIGERCAVIWHAEGFERVTLQLVSRTTISEPLRTYDIATNIPAGSGLYEFMLFDVPLEQAYLKIFNSDMPGCADTTGDVISIDNPTGVDRMPFVFSVVKPFPNPFNPSTTIRFTLPERLNATVAVYNIAGQRVAVLSEGILDSGEHSIVWDAAGHAAGVYFCTVEAGKKYRETVKMTLAK